MGKIALVFIVVLASATFYFTSTSYQNSTKTVQQRTWVDEAGHLHVLGLTLGQSTVRDAELALRSRADAAIFMYPTTSTETQKRFRLVLEAYFPSIADHSKVLLKLDIDNKKLEGVRQRSTSPRMYPNGVARRNLANEDILLVQTLKINTLTLIPSVKLDADVLHAQFGQPKSTQQLDENTMVYNFPELGLIATLKQNDKDKLVFSSPK